MRDEGLFDNLGDTRSETKIDEKTHIVDVTLYFKYAPPVEKKKPDDEMPQEPPQEYQAWRA